MPTPDQPLHAEPADPTPDRGPVHRGGLFAWFVALAFGLAALGAVLVYLRSGHAAWAAACALGCGLVAGRATWCLLEHRRHRAALPSTHAVLAGVLGFEIHSTCRDVAATVFFEPDRLAAGAPARLLCFVENYASRRRVAVFRFGPHPQLGLPAARTVPLHLAAGQAAVYALPLTAAAGLAPGEHDLPVTLQVRKPAGTGSHLPGARRHPYDLWTARFAAPFTVVAPGKRPPAAGALPAPVFLTLASASEPAPRLERLEELIGPGRDASA